MFRLVTTVKRGSASTLLPTWLRYPTIEEARAAAAAVLREDRVQRVMIVRDGTPGTFRRVAGSVMGRTIDRVRHARGVAW